MIDNLKWLPERSVLKRHWSDLECDFIEEFWEKARGLYRTKRKVTVNGFVFLTLLENRAGLSSSALADKLLEMMDKRPKDGKGNAGANKGTVKEDAHTAASRLRKLFDRYNEDNPDAPFDWSLTPDPYCLQLKRNEGGSIPRRAKEFWCDFADKRTVLVLFGANQLWVNRKDGSLLHFGRPSRTSGWLPLLCYCGTGELQSVNVLTKTLTEWKVDVKTRLTEYADLTLTDGGPVILLGSELENTAVESLHFPIKERRYKFELAQDRVFVLGTSFRTPPRVRRWSEKGTDYGVLSLWNHKSTNSRVLWVSATTTFGVQAIVEWLCGRGIEQLQQRIPGFSVKSSGLIEVLVEISLSVQPKVHDIIEPE